MLIKPVWEKRGKVLTRVDLVVSVHRRMLMD